MAFQHDGFSNVFVRGTKVPRMFHYLSEEDTLAQIHATGYFTGSVRILMTPNSFVKVIGIDGTAEFVVQENQPAIKMRKEYDRINWKDKQDYRVPKKDATGKFLKKEESKTG